MIICVGDKLPRKETVGTGESNSGENVVLYYAVPMFDLPLSLLDIGVILTSFEFPSEVFFFLGLLISSDESFLSLP